MNLSSGAHDAERIVLGAAGIGMPYGRPDAQGQEPAQPDEGEVRDLLQAARDVGIRIVDTAPAYGTSEELLGKWWPGEVWTKTQFGHDPQVSLANLNRQNIQLLQWHNWSPDVYQIEFLGQWDTLVHDQRWEQLGVSIYSQDEGIAALDLPELSVIQLPWNILDQKPGSKLHQFTQEKNIKLAGRSVYLQGILAGRQPPSAAAPLEPVIAEVKTLAAEHGLSLPAFAVRAALDCGYLDWVLVGCSTVSELEVIVEALFAPALDVADLSTWCQRDRCPDAALDPRQWN